MTLKSFDSHQIETYPQQLTNKVVNTGVACPNCGKEITFIENGIRTASIPPKVRVKCDCGWSSYLNWR